MKERFVLGGIDALEARHELPPPDDEAAGLVEHFALGCLGVGG